MSSGRTANRFASVRRKRRSAFASALSACALLSLALYRFRFGGEDVDEGQESADPSQESTYYKTILIWNAPERAEIVAFVGFGNNSSGGRNPFSSCRYNKCRIELPNNNGSAKLPLDSYDAIVVNFNDQFRMTNDVPVFQRRPGQRMVFFTQEPPPALKLFNFSRYANYFNWTMTYRKDSDIRLTYGEIRRRQSNRDVTANAKLFNKTKLVAWMATQCSTDGRREDYIRQLRRYIDVDVYGLCGRLKCARHPVDISHPRCYDQLEFTYKFYLSFENSICRDYVTEKFYKILQRRIVPVVYGGADYDSLAPAGSFIDARHYTPQQLAEYLKRIDSDKTGLYESFFRWKEDYEVEAGVEAMARRGFCELCQRLHEDRSIKFYADLTGHWSHPSNECHSPEREQRRIKTI